MERIRGKCTISILLCLSLMSFLLGCSTKAEQKDENHLRQGSEILSTALKTSLETIRNSDGYRYVWTRSFYEEGKEEDTAELENSFLKQENTTILEQKQVYNGVTYRTVYENGNAYSLDGETSGVLCQTPAEIQQEVEGWSAVYLLEKDLEAETVTEANQTRNQYVIQTKTTYDGGSTLWTYFISASNLHIDKMVGEDFDQQGTLYAKVTVALDYSTPQMDTAFLNELNQANATMRTATIVTNPDTDTEKTETYQVPQGFAFYFSPDAGYEFFEDADGKTPADLNSAYGYDDVTLYQIPVEEHEDMK